MVFSCGLGTNTATPQSFHHAPPQVRALMAGSIAIGYLYFGVAALSELSGAYILMLLGHPFKYDFFGTGLKQIASSLVLISVAAVPFMMLFIRPAQHAIIQRKKGLRAYVIAHRCQICPRCLYDLQGRSNDDDTCPECGQIASRRECVRLWGRYLQSF